MYVELVRADLIQAVDGALASEEDAAPALIGAVERCWAGDRFLPAVGDAFGALALELAQRGATGLAARARASGGPRRARAVLRRLRHVLGAHPRDAGERLRGPAGPEPRGRGVTRRGLRRGVGGLRPGGRGVPPGRGGRSRGCD